MDLTLYLRERLKHKHLLLMTHLIVGYPSLEANWQMLEAMQAADVDIVELQLPFSEPIADGPLFLKANQAALQAGIRRQDYFDLMQRATKAFRFPILMMGYYNSAFTMGHRGFCQKLQQCGAAGFILPDLPIEEYGDLFEQSKAHGLHPILLFTPTNTPERLRELGQHGSGFLYCVARKGVTGKPTELDTNVASFLAQCRQVSPLPLALGFGLSQGSDLDQLHGKVEMAIVGSALLKSWEEGGLERYQRHLQELSAHCQ